MARGALADLHALVPADGAVPAALHDRWDYAWPRDGAFVAAALARTGHVDDALAVLGFLERVQGDDGSFEARYLLDGSGPPDGRAPQTDGTGWALWALGTVLDATPAEHRPDVVAGLAPLLERSTAHALDLTADGTRLPPPSPDYWEVRETVTTLGTVAPLLAGLEAASDAWDALADDGTTDDDGTSDDSATDDGTTNDSATEARTTAARVRTAATSLRGVVVETFGARGYPRRVTGGARDAATAFLLPPFVDEPLTGVEDAWRASAGPMRRPAGGLAPGGSWRPDGISWTPQTTLYALAAASVGDRDEAVRLLAWIDAHRTASGAIPEKVLADGSPSAVAPLAWSAANVLLALAALDDA